MLESRHLTNEVMDDLGLEESALCTALSDLGRIQAVSNAAGDLWSRMYSFARARGLKRLRVLDVACGGGHVLRGIAKRAKKRGVSFSGVGLDINPKSVAFANGSVPEGMQLRFQVADALQELPQEFDVVICSLFLHHLSREDAVVFLKNLGNHSAPLVLLHDLIRSKFGYALAFVGTGVLSRSKIIRSDGLASVRAAFSIEEVRGLIDVAGLKGTEIDSIWPARYVVSRELHEPPHAS